LFAFLVVGRSRRQLLWFAVTGRPTAEWLAQQIVEAFALQARGVGKDAGGQYSAVGADATQPAGVNEYRLGTHTGDGSCRRDPGRATTKNQYASRHDCSLATTKTNCPTFPRWTPFTAARINEFWRSGALVSRRARGPVRDDEQ
jgi:hypothetical protein